MSVVSFFRPRRYLASNVAIAIMVGSILLLPLTGCSIKRMAINKMGDALSQSTGGTFTSDNDPELIGDALPFSLKLMESILAETPEHIPLLTSLSKGFTSYSYAYVQLEADYVEEDNLERAREMRDRARNLYIRARNYGLQGLEAKQQGFTNAFFTDPTHALQSLKQSDKETRDLVQWTISPWAAAISVSKDHPELIADLPYIEAMIEWMFAWEGYAQEQPLASIMMSFESVRTKISPEEGNLEARIRRDFAAAIRMNGGYVVGPYVTLAEGVSIQNQNVQEFRSLLETALAIDVDAAPESRLENLLLKKRARWLLSRIDDLFLAELPPEELGN